MVETTAPARQPSPPQADRQYARALVGRVVACLPEEFTLRESLERIDFVDHAETQRAAYERGELEFVSHVEATARVRSWLESSAAQSSETRSPRATIR